MTEFEREERALRFVVERTLHYRAKVAVAERTPPIVAQSDPPIPQNPESSTPLVVTARLSLAGPHDG